MYHVLLQTSKVHWLYLQELFQMAYLDIVYYYFVYQLILMFHHI